MLPGEQTSYVSSLGTLYLVPMTDGGAKPLPKSIRKPQHPEVLLASTQSVGAQSCTHLFNHDILREQTISPIQCTSTNFRLFVKPVSSSGVQGGDSVRLSREIAIPYMLVDRYEIEIRAPKTFALTVFTKWTWVLRIQSVTEEPVQSLANILQQNFPQAVHQFFAFTYFRALVDELHGPYGATGAGGQVALRKESAMEFERSEGLLQRSQTVVMQLSSSSDPVPPSLRDGDGVYDTAWGAFNIERELHRQTVLNGVAFDKDNMPMALPQAGDTALSQFGCGKNLLPWFHIVKLSRIDIFYTYPTTVIAPRKVSEELLNKCAAYRHAGRVPIVTWIHGVNGATLSRSAQPKAGSRKPAKDDQTLCSYLNQSYHHTNAAPSTSHAMHDPVDGRGGVGGAVGHRTRTGSPPPAALLLPPGDGTSTIGLSKKPPSLFEKDSSSDSQDEAEADVTLTIPPPSTLAAAVAPSISKEPVNAPPATELTANKSEMRPLHIIDCRSRTAATANLAAGGGFENVRNYDRASIDFMGLDNIHVVRDSFDKLRKLCVSMQQPQLDAPTTRNVYGSFHSKLESTGWVELQERLLWASWRTATLLANGASVLVHCTDGWDRTAQVTSLAKLQLDAHYRSVEGFCELVMVEWLEMGHKFADRCGLERSAPSDDNDEGFVHVDSDGEEASDNEDEANCSAPYAPSPRAAHQEDFKGPTHQNQQGGIASFFTSPKRNKSHSPSSQLSPIFTQFIDAVFQLIHMFPTAFEFTAVFLEMLLEAVYSCQFGTFLYNTHRLRTRKNGLVSKTMSVWGAIEHRLTRERMKANHAPDGTVVPAEDRLLNVFYRPVVNRCPQGASCEDVAAAFANQRIIPSFHAFRYRMWTSLYARYMWEGTGCPTDGESLHPMADALLVMAEKYRSLEARLTMLSGGASSAGGLGISTYLASWVGGGNATSGDGDGEVVNRYMFLHRIAQSHLTADWQLLTRNASDGAADSEGGRPILLLGGDLGTADASQLISPSNANITNGIGLQGGGNVVVFKTRDDKNHCQLCSAEFTMFFRRHTCRRCCRTACIKCADNFVVMPPNSIALYDDRGATHPVRICNVCSAEMRRSSAVNRGVAPLPTSL
jgi:hypothetical protein